MKFFLLFSLLLSGLLLGSDLPSFSFVEVSGFAKREVKPDEVEIGFQVSAFADNSKSALELHEGFFGAVLAVLKENGIDEKSLKATEIRKSEVRKTEDRKSLDVLGYDVKQSITIKMESLKNYSPLMRLLIELEGVTSLRSDFGSTKEEEVAAELVGEACREAKKTAKRLTDGMDVRLGSIFAINDDGSSFVSKGGGGIFAMPGELGAGLLPPLNGDGGNRKTLFFVPEFIVFRSSVRAMFRIETELE